MDKHIFLLFFSYSNSPDNEVDVQSLYPQGDKKVSQGVEPTHPKCTVSLPEAFHRTLHLELLYSGFDQGLSHFGSRSCGCESSLPFRGWVRWGREPHQRV